MASPFSLKNNVQFWEKCSAFGNFVHLGKCSGIASCWDCRVFLLYKWHGGYAPCMPAPGVWLDSFQGASRWGHTTFLIVLPSHLTSFYLKLQIDSISYHYRLYYHQMFPSRTTLSYLFWAKVCWFVRPGVKCPRQRPQKNYILYTFVAGSSAARLREALAFLVMSRRHFSKTTRYQKVMPKSTWHVEHAVKTCQTCMNMIEYEYVALHRASSSTMFIYDSNPRRTPYFQVYSSQQLFMIVHDS